MSVCDEQSNFENIIKEEWIRVNHIICSLAVKNQSFVVGRTGYGVATGLRRLDLGITLVYFVHISKIKQSYIEMCLTKNK